MTVKHSNAYKQLGDSYWPPDAVFTIWNEASTGKIPVKGMGYKGSFGGEGFDGIWTDMSEIVRPTRDGVYGREYISTIVDIGRKLSSINFAHAAPTYPSVEVPIPIIFDELPLASSNNTINSAVGIAAEKLGTYNVSRKWKNDHERIQNMIPIVDEEHLSLNQEYQPRIIEWEADKTSLFEELVEKHPSSTIIARLPLKADTAELATKLAHQGVHGLHLYADYHGRDYSAANNHVSEAVKKVHQHLVREGVRDQITIIASGGVTLAEHVPKMIICGADLVGIDTTILVAVQAEFSGETHERASPGLKPRKIDPDWGSQRIVNLMSAWHDQLIEILSAMGMRDVRRLRGDIGRSMMDSELREQSFKGIP